MNEVIALLNQRLPLVSKNALVHLSLHDAPVVSECEVRASVHLSTEFHGVVVDHLLVPPLAELEAARACVYVAAWLESSPS